MWPVTQHPAWRGSSHPHKAHKKWIGSQNNTRMTTHYHPIMKHPTEQQLNYWLNRIHCGVLRNDSEKETTACRKFHDMCAVDMLANIRFKTFETHGLKFKKKVRKEIIAEIHHLVNRLIGARKLLADQDDMPMSTMESVFMLNLRKSSRRF